MELAFSRDGFAIVPHVLSVGECEALAKHVTPETTASGGTRCLLSQSWCALLADRLRQHREISRLVPRDFVAVQCTYFEKSALRNWLVPFHQDLSIPVAEHVDNPALRGWSEKESSLFVQAPVEVLEQMVSVRVHLDECGEEDGPLRVIPGSHTYGRIDAEAMQVAKAKTAEVACVAEQGGVLVLRPLLLHASSKGTGESRRRVLHFVFGPRELPFSLMWKQAV